MSSAEARERLLALGDAWLRTSAEVSYGTEAPQDGQPKAAHQCLRQMVEDTPASLAEAKLKCSRQGQLELTWDPPDRWRMEVTTPLGHFTVISSPVRTRLCAGGDPHACRTIPMGRAIARAQADVFFRRPEQILEEIGTSEVTSIASPAEAVVPVECFAASGHDEHVEWCYSADGVLLSFLRGSGRTGWESVEANEVS